MDCIKVGKLILNLRKEKGLTQKQLGDLMNISDKAISKWERGLGIPDVSLLHELSEILNVNIGKILMGNLDKNDIDGGNMKKIKFYTCETCGNILTSTSDAEISCCGRKLSPLQPKKSDENHRLNIEEIEDDFYITFSHEMEKTHYLNFIACVTCDRILLVKLYPEQGGELRIPRISGGKFYFSCSKDGFWVND
ncbi:MAG: helix-turn-helix domain-containing protein [Oscillospiraceae bacterium]